MICSEKMKNATGTRERLGGKPLGLRGPKPGFIRGDCEKGIPNAVSRSRILIELSSSSEIRLDLLKISELSNPARKGECVDKDEGEALFGTATLAGVELLEGALGLGKLLASDIVGTSDGTDIELKPWRLRCFLEGPDEEPTTPGSCCCS